MKDKKLGAIIFAVVCVVIIVACVAIQVVIKNKDKESDKESQKYETSSKETKTENKNIDDDKFHINVPETFKQLDYETMAQGYLEGASEMVFSNEASNANITVTKTDNEIKNSQISYYKDYMENILKENGEIVASNYYEVNNHNVGQIKVITKTAEVEIYNNIIYFSDNDKLVIITFNCPNELRDELQGVGDSIIDSLSFTE